MAKVLTENGLVYQADAVVVEGEAEVQVVYRIIWKADEEKASELSLRCFRFGKKK